MALQERVAKTSSEGLKRMKAAERKHLETNSLSEQMTKMWQGGMKSPGTVWVLLGVAIVVGVLFWWLTSTLSLRAADSWSKLWFGQNSFGLAGDNAELKNSPAGLAAELLAADSLVSGARFTIQSDISAAAGVLESAADRYMDVAKRATGVPEVRLRALVAAAKCHETIGQLDRALEIYKSAVAAAQAQGLIGHPLAKEAADRVTLLTGPKSEGQEFYTQWPARLPKAKPDENMEAPKPPPIPTMPAPIDPSATAPKPTTLAPPTATLPTSPAANPQRPDMGTSPAATTPAATTPAATKPAGTPPAATAPAATAPAPTTPK